MKKSKFLLELDKSCNGDSRKVEERFFDILKKFLGEEVVWHTGGPQDLGIDGIYSASYSENIILFQLKARQSQNYSKLEKESQINNFEIKIKKFILESQDKAVKNEIEGIKKISSLIKREQIKNIDAYFISFSKIENKKDKTELVGDINVNFKYIGHEKVEEILDQFWINSWYLSHKGKKSFLPLRENKYIKHNDNCYTIEVNINDLINFLSKFSESLDEQSLTALSHKNVRDFLGEKKQTNKAILNTITSEEFKNNLFFHMGIVITSEKLNLDSKNKKIEILTPSFVNGAQTVSIIREAHLHNKCEVETKFTVKIIETKDEALNEKIVLATNSQTIITDAMKYAFDSKQKKLAAQFASYGYYYEFRGISPESEKKWIERIKEKSKLLNYDNLFKDIIGTTKIKPSKLAQALYVLENPEKYGQSYTSLKSFWYQPEKNSNDNDIYYKTFYDCDQKKQKAQLREFKQYLIALAVVNTVIKNKDLFKNPKTEFKDNKIFLSKADFPRLRFLLTGLWVQEIKKELEKDDIFGIVEQIVKSGVTKFENKIKFFVKKFKDTLEKEDQHKWTKALFEIGSVEKIIKKSDLF